MTRVSHQPFSPLTWLGMKSSPHKQCLESSAFAIDTFVIFWLTVFTVATLSALFTFAAAHMHWKRTHSLPVCATPTLWASLIADPFSLSARATTLLIVIVYYSLYLQMAFLTDQHLSCSSPHSVPSSASMPPSSNSSFSLSFIFQTIFFFILILLYIIFKSNLFIIYLSLCSNYSNLIGNLLIYSFLLSFHDISFIKINQQFFIFLCQILNFLFLPNMTQT